MTETRQDVDSQLGKHLNLSMEDEVQRHIWRMLDIGFMRARRLQDVVCRAGRVSRDGLRSYTFRSVALWRPCSAEESCVKGAQQETAQDSETGDPEGCTCDAACWRLSIAATQGTRNNEAFEAGDRHLLLIERNTPSEITAG